MENNSIKLMTLHASKGLEFNYVFIVGANEGLIPMKSNSCEEFEEEKRLFFVGITRAKNDLEISYITSPSGYGVFANRSRFIDMIPSHLKQMKFNENISNNFIKDMVKEVKREIIDTTIETQENSSKTLVNHHHYGNGYIESIEDGIIKVVFDNYGEKEFIEGLEDYEIISSSENLQSNNVIQEEELKNQAKIFNDDGFICSESSPEEFNTTEYLEIFSSFDQPPPKKKWRIPFKK